MVGRKREGRHQRRSHNPDLTPAELEILKFFFFGYKEIAKRRCVSKLTIGTHAINILGKLQARTKTQAVIIALKRGIIGLEDLLTE